MTRQASLESSFALGEIDPALYNRVETTQYRKSCKKLTNFIVSSLGTARKRSGFSQYLDVTSLISDSTNFKLIVKAVSSPLQSSRAVLIVLVENVANLILTDQETPTVQSIVLTRLTAEQAQEATFLAAESDIIILHKSAPPERIKYNGTDFSLELYNFSKEPTFDLGEVSYFSDNVYIQAPASGSNVTEVHIENTNFTQDWVGGVIVGPGIDAVSPLGSGRIIGLTFTATETVFDVLATLPFKTSTGYSTSSLTGSDLSIQQPIFTDDLGYPGIGKYYKNRIWFSGHPRVPLTLFGSKPGSGDNFDVGTGNPEDAIIYSMEEDTVGDIIFINVGKQLQIFTELAEFSVPEDGSGLTPQNFAIKRQTNFGVSKVCAPTNYQDYTFFAGGNGKTIYKYEESGGLEASFSTSNISELATHLIKQPKKLTTFYSTDQATVLLALLNADNTISVLSYSKNDEVAAWTSFTFAENTELLDMDSANNILYSLTSFNLTDRKYLQRLDFSNFIPVDGATPVNLPAQDIDDPPPTISDLNEFNDYVVSVTDGVSFLGDYEVVNGSITLDDPVENFFSGYVGLKYLPVLTPLNALQNPAYVYGRKVVDAIYLDYAQSLAIKINNEIIPYQNFEEIRRGETLQLKNGTYEYLPQEGWNRYTDFTVTQTAPVGLHILSFGYRMKEGGL